MKKEKDLVDIIVIPAIVVEKCQVEAIETVVSIYIEMSKQRLIDAIKQYKNKANKT